MTKINTTNVEVSTITASWLNAKADFLGDTATLNKFQESYTVAL